MGWLTSSKSEASSSSSSGTPAAPTREERKVCWTARDAYFDCLTSKGVTIPPGTDMSDGRGLVGKAAAEDQKRAPKSTDADPCQPQRAEYEAHCAKSWIDYFNKRRVLEERQKLMYAQAEAENARKR